MRLIKKNLKVIIAFILGAILVGGIVYAAVSAREVSYTTNKNGEIANVEEALNDLYNNMSNETKTITTNGEQTLDKYYKNLNVNVSQVYETGEFSQYLEYGIKTVLITLNFENTYTAADNAKLLIYDVSAAQGGTGVIYFNTGINNKITSNSMKFYMLNYAGEAKYSQTYTCKYAVVKYSE